MRGEVASASPSFSLAHPMNLDRLTGMLSAVFYRLSPLQTQLLSSLGPNHVGFKKFAT